MTVAINDYAESGSFGLEVELSEIMQYINGDAAGFHDFSFGESAGPGRSVHVSSDRGYWRDLFEGFEDFWRADVAGVKDEVGSAEGFEGSGAQQTVGVRDYSNDHWFLWHGSLVAF